MKKVYLLLAFVFVGLTSNAQGIVEKYYSDLEEDETTTSVFVSSHMFEMIAKLDIESDDEEFNKAKDFINKVHSFSLIKTEPVDNAMALYKKGHSQLRNSHEELVRVRDKDTRINLYVDGDDETIYEVAFIGVVDGEFIAASLLGELRYDQISDLINEMEDMSSKEGSFRSMSKIASVGAGDMKVYPNPSSSNTQLTVEVPENLVGGTARLIDNNGQVLKEVTVDGANQQISTDNVPSGTYYVELAKEGVSIQKKVIVLE